MVSAAGNDDDLDASRCSFGDGAGVFGVEVSLGVEEGPIEVHGDHLDWHGTIVACRGAGIARGS